MLKIRKRRQRDSHSDAQVEKGGKPTAGASAKRSEEDIRNRKKHSPTHASASGTVEPFKTGQVEATQGPVQGLLDPPIGGDTVQPTQTSSFVQGLFDESQRFRAQRRKDMFGSHHSSFTPLQSESPVNSNPSVSDANVGDPAVDGLEGQASPELSYHIRVKGTEVNRYNRWTVSDAYKSPTPQPDPEEEEAVSTDEEEAHQETTHVPAPEIESHAEPKQNPRRLRQHQDSTESENEGRREAHADRTSVDEESNGDHSSRSSSLSSGTHESDKHEDDFKDMDAIDDDYIPSDEQDDTNYGVGNSSHGGASDSSQIPTSLDHNRPESPPYSRHDDNIETEYYWPVPMLPYPRSCIQHHIRHEGAVSVFATESDPFLAVRPGNLDPHTTIYDMKLIIGCLGFPVIAVRVPEGIAGYISPDDPSYKQLVSFLCMAPCHIVQLKIKWDFMESLQSVGYRYSGSGNWAALCNHESTASSLWAPPLPERPHTARLESMALLSTAVPRDNQSPLFISSSSTVTRALREDGRE
ncbi:hypothetical protein BJ508DRAFT_336249 [Ascobolus immersus RN42]|uniref:Uncharacterized protein n=1 Tax=Ascobolus immersus RN42 TaxID=1160509 RepID=A0A3N4HE20_ASCIM|nr:hypothetical protein BJ508DRAFT_336249 [Ascobolus immersus RN42]